jgi:hypothetical protein
MSIWPHFVCDWQQRLIMPENVWQRSFPMSQNFCSYFLFLWLKRIIINNLTDNAQRPFSISTQCNPHFLSI